ncbi:trigger factor [Mechercharimyces sp. CAU 1602]|uniref:trigger factor n=1 Tax=Mechercharimyces sp. CAU 1602 TaxID=2973933 RepID=UPI002162D9C2|nr:trigger factor [Mechercharimyces sp. CAU 1602]MCS1351476.1 trigger factor [Mechercharimyces sp. CAU 1602]
MSAKWEKTETNKGILTVEVEAEKVNEALDQAFTKVIKKVSVPGFRKGKVPRPIFEKRFGVESLYQDALDILLPEAYGSAVEEAGIEPVDQPEIDLEQIEKGAPLIFKATVTVKPEVKLGQYKELEIEEKDFSVSDEDIEAELKKMQEQQGQLEVVEEGEVAEGDRVILDFDGMIDGERFEGGQAEQYNLEVGSGQFIPGFEEQLVGMKVGDEKDVLVSFPEEYHAENLAGKEATFHVKMHEIKRLSLPVLDDEFAQDVSDFDTLAELQADTRKNLEEKAKREQEDYIRNSLVEKATENAEIELPAVMIESQVDHMVQQFEQQLRYQGITLEQYQQLLGQDDDAIRSQFREDAEKKVRADLVLEQIGIEESIEVSDEDLEAELKELASEMDRDLEEVRQILNSQGNIEAFKDQVKVKKTVDLLVSNSKNAA